MSIRPATANDVPVLVELGRAMHAVSSYAHISYNADKVRHSLIDLINGQGVVFAAERAGRVIGGLAGYVTPYWFSDELLGMDLTLLIDPASKNGITALRLIAAFEYWCKAKQARQMKLGITTGIHVEATEKLYDVAGLKRDGIVMKVEL